MATGILIAESLQPDATLQVAWQLTRIERITVSNLSREQRAAGLPSAWTLLRLKLPDANARALAQALADKLLRPCWYAEFSTEAETFTVFAGRVFRYRNDDHEARVQALAYGAAHGTPEEQIIA
jgi:hypothetical protein